MQVKAASKKGQDAGFARLASVLAGDDEDEDEEPAFLPTGTDRPRWWTEAKAKQCPVCGKIILPKRLGSKQTWEVEKTYSERKTCSLECSYTVRQKSREKA